MEKKVDFKKFMFYVFCFSIWFSITSKTEQKRRYLKRQEEEWMKKLKFIKCVLHIKMEFYFDVDTLWTYNYWVIEKVFYNISRGTG